MQIIQEQDDLVFVISYMLVWLAQNVVLISIPSVMDADLAPAGKHTLHAYLPATEPFAFWAGESSCPLQ